jgi:hypothetical protein
MPSPSVGPVGWWGAAASTPGRLEWPVGRRVSQRFAPWPKASAPVSPSRPRSGKPAYPLATLHRPSKADNPVRLAALVDLLTETAGKPPVVFPVHLFTRGTFDAAGCILAGEARRGCPPAVGRPLRGADSGGHGGVISVSAARAGYFFHSDKLESPLPHASLGPLDRVAATRGNLARKCHYVARAFKCIDRTADPGSVARVRRYSTAMLVLPGLRRRRCARNRSLCPLRLERDRPRDRPVVVQRTAAGPIVQGQEGARPLKASCAKICCTYSSPPSGI